MKKERQERRKNEGRACEVLRATEAAQLATNKLPEGLGNGCGIPARKFLTTRKVAGASRPRLPGSPI